MSRRHWIGIAAAAALLLGGGSGWILLHDPGERRPAGIRHVRRAAPSRLVSLETFTVNLNDADAERFARLTLRLAVQPPGVADRIASDDLLRARIRDRTLTLLASKTYRDLITPLGKESLRREIKGRLAPLLGPEAIEDVLFDELIVQ